jgi:prepilin-type N-terminal cleavage/methylation domain-containing protein
MALLAPSGPASSRRGYTLIELLFAMAVIVLIMSIASQAFVAGLETFRQLKGIGDLNERLRGDALALRGDVEAANRSAAEFILDGLRRGSADPEEAAALRDDYQAICDDAEDLEERLREVERQTVNPVARRLLRRTIGTLDDVKEAAAIMVDILELLESAGPGS